VHPADTGNKSRQASKRWCHQTINRLHVNEIIEDSKCDETNENIHVSHHYITTNEYPRGRSNGIEHLLVRLCGRVWLHWNSADIECKECVLNVYWPRVHGHQTVDDWKQTASGSWFIHSFIDHTLHIWFAHCNISYILVIPCRTWLRLPVFRVLDELCWDWNVETNQTTQSMQLRCVFYVESWRLAGWVTLLMKKWSPGLWL
jgi:hypothetical protein